MTHYDWLLSRLDAFTRKYYVNQLLRGVLILLSCLLFYIITASLSEYYLYLPSWLRVSIVSVFAVAGLAALVFWIILPLLRIARMGRIISREQAATIVGKHFPEISDKLLNILQLRKDADSNASRELLEASIDQKASQLAVVPITRAVDLSKNRRYLPFFLPLLLIGLFILIAAPSVFRDASARLLQPTKTFERPAPFSFIIKNNNLQALRNTDFTLQAAVQGNALPSDMFIELGNEQVPMQADSVHRFQYTFRNVTAPVTFRLLAAGFYSKPYTLQVAQKPLLKAFTIHIDYPAYTGHKNEVRSNLGDMTLPVGTTVSYGFLAEHTENATWQWANGATAGIPHQGDMYGFQHRFMNDTAYTIALHNRQTLVADEYHYNVKVIQDEYPTLQTQEFRDTTTGNQILVSGTAGDDYSISRVAFQYHVSNDKNVVLSSKSIPLKSGGGALVPFQYYFDIQSLDLQPGQKLTYYVEAWDNDGVHGPKSSRSEAMTYQAYNAKQIDSAMNQNAQQINSGLSNSAQQTQKLQEEYKETQSKMMQSNDMSFEQQQQLQEMVQKQQKLQEQVADAKKRFDEQVKQSEKKEFSDDVRDKQKELQNQMDNLLNKELAEQMKKLQDLMQKLNKQDAVKTMEQMQQDNKLFDMDMKRMQELMKQLEEQMRMEDLANKMDALAKKEGDLSKQTAGQKKDNPSLSKDQQDIKKELDNTMQGDMKDLQKLNTDVQQKQDLQQPQQKANEAGQNMQQSQQQLGQNQNSKASQSQSKAAQNLQDMADKLRSMAGGMDVQQIELDIKATRQILTNLIRLSFDQEALMKQVRTVPVTSQLYLADQTEQNRLHGNSRMIRDSLFSLSKKVFKLATTVNKETTELESNMGQATNALEGRQVGMAITRQQYVMTHANNLALMLNELLSNLLQQQAKAKKGGSGTCSKPGGSNPKPGGQGAGQQLSDIITGQQQLGDAMQQMQGAGKKPGQGEKPGPGGKDGKEGENGKDGQNGKEGQNGKQGGQKREARRKRQRWWRHRARQ